MTGAGAGGGAGTGAAGITGGATGRGACSATGAGFAAGVNPTGAGTGVSVATAGAGSVVAISGRDVLSARIMFDSIKTSFGPPIITRCSTLSRRTMTSLRPLRSRLNAPVMPRRCGWPRPAAETFKVRPKIRISPQMTSKMPIMSARPTASQTTYLDPSGPNTVHNCCIRKRPHPAQ